MLERVVAHNLQAGSVISGRFRLDRELGRGGMGTVWEACHLALETQVAIKFLKSELSQRQDTRFRFAREATSAARIRSPNVVSVLDSGFTEEDDYAFIVMELLLGEDLGKKLSRVGICSIEETRTLVLQVARGLSKAHAAGILHRDLKPENLFVSNDEEATIKILDFGIAKAFGPEAATHKTDTGQLLGTPMYMSPEQALGRNLDVRSDLYSLAVVAYRCLAGRTPFDHAAPGEMIVAVSMHTPPPPSLFNPALPLILDAWFANALAKDPDSRSCQSASDLADSFQEVCSQALAVSPRPSPAPPAYASEPPGSTLRSEVRSFSAVELATTVMMPGPVLPPPRRSRLQLVGAVAFSSAVLGGLFWHLQRSPKPLDWRSRLAARSTPSVSTMTLAPTSAPASELPSTSAGHESSERHAVTAVVSSRRPKLPQPQPASRIAKQAEQLPPASLAPAAEVAEAAPAPTDAALVRGSGNAARPPQPNPSNVASHGDTPPRAARTEADSAQLGMDRRSPW